MAQNPIDKAFQEKLLGREVGGYSAGAWAGAEKMLNAHYKWLWLKNALWFVLPVTFVSILGITTVMWYDGGVENAPTGNAAKSMENAAIPFLVDSTEYFVFESSFLDEETASGSATATIKPSIETNDPEVHHGNQQSSLTATRGGKPAQYAEDEIAKEGLTSNNTDKGNAFERGDLSASTSSAPVASMQPKARSKSSQPSRFPFGADLDALLGIDNTVVENTTATAEFESFDVKEDMLKMPLFSFAYLGHDHHSDSLFGAMTEHDLAAILSPRNKVQLAAFAGPQMSRGLLNSDGSRHAMSADWHFGLEAAFAFQKRAWILSGVTVQHNGAMSADQLLVGDRLSIGTYDRLESLTFVEVPFGLGFDVGTRHRVGGGLKYAHLINRRSSVFEVDHAESTEQMLSNVATREDKPGLSPFDVGGFVNYNFQISQPLSVGASFHAGLFDLLEDNAYGQTSNDQQIQLRLCLSYRFLNR